MRSTSKMVGISVKCILIEFSWERSSQTLARRRLVADSFRPSPPAAA